MIGLYIAGAVFLLLVVLFLLPIGISLVYGPDGLDAKCVIGWVRFPITGLVKKITASVSGKKKSGKKDSEKNEEESSEPTEKAGSWTDFLPLVRVGLEFLNTFRRRMYLRRLELKLMLAGDDPCDLGVRYGQSWIALTNLLPRLERLFRIKKHDLHVECDFTATETRIFARAEGLIPLGCAVVILVKYGVIVIKKYITIQNSRKGGASNE